MLICAIFMFCGIFPVTAFADNATVTSGTMYSYFQTFSSSGSWVDVQTPSHWITQTGEVAYCLQTQRDSPYNAGYHTVDGSDYYNTRVLTGLYAILQNGYPMKNGGYSDEQARYATANAIRFWMAENYCDGMPQYLNLNVNGDWIRGKSGYEDLYSWALSLVQLARNQSVSGGTAGSISFSPSSLTLEQDEDYFVGSATVSKSISGAYGLSHNLPDGSTIDGYNGNNGDRLTIKIPPNYELQTYTLTAYGSHNQNTAKLFFYAPDAANQQRVVTCVLDSESLYVEGNMTVNTPKAIPRNGYIELSKVDEDGTPVPGVSFALYDSGKAQISTGQTNGSGLVRFEVPIGDYFYSETATLPHLVLDNTLYPISVTEGGQTVQKTVINEFARGNISVLKTNAETGEALPGVHFLLLGGGSVLAEGNTGQDGRLTFSGLRLGSYQIQESATVEGFVLDSTPIPVEVTAHGQTVEVSRENVPIRGNLKIVKKDAYEDINLMGAGFRIFDGSGAVVAEGYTSASGEVTFSNLPYGKNYTYQEFKAPKGFELDETVYPFAITEHGVTITEERENIRRPGTLVVKKQDENGSPLAGAAFLLEYSTDKGSTWQPVTYREGGDEITRGGCTSPGLVDGQLTTDSNGTVTFTGLRADSLILYRLTETVAPEGRSLLGGSLYVGTLPVESENIYASDAEVFDSKAFVYTLYVTATDDPIFRLPETGGGGFDYLPLVMLCMASPFILGQRHTIAAAASCGNFAPSMRYFFLKYTKYSCEKVPLSDTKFHEIRSCRIVRRCPKKRKGELA